MKNRSEALSIWFHTAGRLFLIKDFTKRIISEKLFYLLDDAKQEKNGCGGWNLPLAWLTFSNESKMMESL